MRRLILLLLLPFWSSAQLPIIYADVPDPSMIRVGDTYYMSSTTMHMNPGVPVMKSKDLVNWEIIHYAYEELEPDLDLGTGKSMYGKGSWASSLRYHEGTYYLSTFALNTGKTYIFTTKDIEKGPWERKSFQPAFHDHTLFFEDGKPYLIYGAGKLMLVPLKEDLTGVAGKERVLIENANLPAGPNIGLNAEGSQLFKHDGKYYLFNIVWPKGGMRTVLIHRAESLQGPWEGRVAFQDMGIAQGGMIDTPDGKWWAYLFRDMGSVGRVPYWVPIQWKDGWPVIGDEGKFPKDLPLPAGKGLIPGIVNSDEFTSNTLSLVWQWNHNADSTRWSLTDRKGFMRLKMGQVGAPLLQTRNMLTQRTIGPKCTGEVKIDVRGLKEGDVAGLIALQSDYAWVGVKVENGQRFLVVEKEEEGKKSELLKRPWKGNTVFVRIHCDFTDFKDEATFSFSSDGKRWEKASGSLAMKYKLTHFMGYRFGLFVQATKSEGGYADFDYYKINEL